MPAVVNDIVVCDGSEAPMLAAETGVNVTLSCCSWCRDGSVLDDRGDFMSSPPISKDFMSLDFDDVGVSEMAAADDDVSWRILFES